MRLYLATKSDRLLGHDRAMTILVIASLGAWILAAAGMAATGMTVRLGSMKPLGLLLVVQIALAFYCRFRAISRLTPAVETICVFLAANIALLPISYVGMRFALPIADQQLMAIDDLMGFDWREFVGLVGANQLLSAFLGIAYMSFGAQLFLLPVYFALIGRTERGYAMILAYIMIVVVSTVIATFFPSEGAFVAYGIDRSAIGHVDPYFGYAFLEEFNAVRNAPTFEMSLDRVQGLLTFPSVHVAVAVLCLWAALGSRLLIAPFLALNVAMAASAISHGGHYLVDVLAGAIVAAICIAAAKVFFPRSGAIAARQAEADTFAAIRARRHSSLALPTGQT
jgi:membrane-associated phospholipid phosphatase